MVNTSWLLSKQKKNEEILELLLAADYFPARIKGLRPFDKVIGGLTWRMNE